MGTIKPRRRLAGCLAAAVILGVSGVVAGTAPQASAQQALSEGCTTLNDPLLDSAYSGAGPGPRQYLAGEVITVSAGEPTSAGTPTATQLRVNQVVVASGGFPATLSYTVPADGTYTVNWFAIVANATWNVSCTPPLVCTITGTAKGDGLVGTAGPDVICGLGGGDSIDGRGGNDIVFGGDGGDSIVGGPGQDQLFGEAGGDSIDARDGAPGDVVIGGVGGDSMVGDPGDSLTQ